MNVHGEPEFKGKILDVACNESRVSIISISIISISMIFLFVSDITRLYYSLAGIPNHDTCFYIHKHHFLRHNGSRGKTPTRAHLLKPIRVCYTWITSTQCPVTKVTSDDIIVMTS